MAGNTRTLKLVIAGDPSGAVGAFSKTEKAAGGFQSKMKGVGATVGKALAIGGVVGVAGAGLVAIGSQVLTLGGQVETYRRKSKTVFEGSADDIAKWADSNAASFGLTDDELTGLAAGFGDLLKPMGFTAGQATTMTKDVVGLAGALSSWTGGQKSASEVADTLAKAMLGEREELKGLGISISEAEVQAALLAKGQNKLTGTALQQAKALATQELIFAKSTDAQKAWAAGGSKALATQNKMSAAFKEVKETLATKLTPVITAFGDYLLRTMPKVTRFVQEHAAAFKVAAGVVGGVMVVAMLAYAASAASAAVATIAATWPILAVVAAVALLVAGLTYAYKHWDWFRKGVDATVRFLKGVAWPLVKQFAQGIAAEFRVMSSVVAAVFRTVKNNIVQPIQSAVSTVGGWVNAIPGFFSGMGDRISRASSGMFSGLKSAFRSAVNWIIDAWNGLQFKIPGFDPPGPGPKFSGFTLGTPNIPRLHSGGMVTGPSGSEQLRILQAGEYVLSRSQVAAASSGGGKNAPMNVNVYLDGKQIEAVVRTHANRTQSVTGNPWLQTV